MQVQNLNDAARLFVRAFVIFNLLTIGGCIAIGLLR